MKSLDPWRVIVTDPHGDVVVPRPHYEHPFYGPYAHGPYAHGRTFVGASPWIDSTGANHMTNRIGAQLTALSAPYGYAHPFYGPFSPYLGAEAQTPPVPGVAPPVVIPVAPGDLPQRTGLTKELASIVAPATGGIR